MPLNKTAVYDAKRIKNKHCPEAKKSTTKGEATATIPDGHQSRGMKERNKNATNDSELAVNSTSFSNRLGKREPLDSCRCDYRKEHRKGTRGACESGMRSLL